MYHWKANCLQIIASETISDSAKYSIDSSDTAVPEVPALLGSLSVFIYIGKQIF